MNNVQPIVTKKTTLFPASDMTQLISGESDEALIMSGGERKLNTAATNEIKPSTAEITRPELISVKCKDNLKGKFTVNECDRSNESKLISVESDRKNLISVESDKKSLISVESDKKGLISFESDKKGLISVESGDTSKNEQFETFENHTTENVSGESDKSGSLSVEFDKKQIISLGCRVKERGLVCCSCVTNKNAESVQTFENRLQGTRDPGGSRHFNECLGHEPTRGKKRSIHCQTGAAEKRDVWVEVLNPLAVGGDSPMLSDKQQAIHNEGQARVNRNESQSTEVKREKGRLLLNEAGSVLFCSGSVQENVFFGFEGSEECVSSVQENEFLQLPENYHCENSVPENEILNLSKRENSGSSGNDNDFLDLKKNGKFGGNSLENEFLNESGSNFCALIPGNNTCSQILQENEIGDSSDRGNEFPNLGDNEEFVGFQPENSTNSLSENYNLKSKALKEKEEEEEEEEEEEKEEEVLFSKKTERIVVSRCYNTDTNVCPESARGLIAAEDQKNSRTANFNSWDGSQIVVTPDTFKTPLTCHCGYPCDCNLSSGQFSQEESASCPKHREPAHQPEGSGCDCESTTSCAYGCLNVNKYFNRQHRTSCYCCEVTSDASNLAAKLNKSSGHAPSGALIHKDYTVVDSLSHPAIQSPALPTTCPACDIYEAAPSALSQHCQEPGPEDDKLFSRCSNNDCHNKQINSRDISSNHISTASPTTPRFNLNNQPSTNQPSNYPINNQPSTKHPYQHRYSRNLDDNKSTNQSSNSPINNLDCQPTSPDEDLNTNLQSTRKLSPSIQPNFTLALHLPHDCTGQLVPGNATPPKRPEVTLPVGNANSAPSGSDAIVSGGKLPVCDEKSTVFNENSLVSFEQSTISTVADCHGNTSHCNKETEEHKKTNKYINNKHLDTSSYPKQSKDQIGADQISAKLTIRPKTEPCVSNFITKNKKLINIKKKTKNGIQSGTQFSLHGREVTKRGTSEVKCIVQIKKEVKLSGRSNVDLVSARLQHKETAVAVKGKKKEARAKNIELRPSKQKSSTHGSTDCRIRPREQKSIVNSQPDRSSAKGNGSELKRGQYVKGHGLYGNSTREREQSSKVTETPKRRVVVRETRASILRKGGQQVKELGMTATIEGAPRFQLEASAAKFQTPFSTKENIPSEACTRSRNRNPHQQQNQGGSSKLIKGLRKTTDSVAENINTSVNKNKEHKQIRPANMDNEVSISNIDVCLRTKSADTCSENDNADDPRRTHKISTIFPVESHQEPQFVGLKTNIQLVPVKTKDSSESLKTPVTKKTPGLKNPVSRLSGFGARTSGIPTFSNSAAKKSTNIQPTTGKTQKPTTICKSSSKKKCESSAPRPISQSDETKLNYHKSSNRSPALTSDASCIASDDLLSLEDHTSLSEATKTVEEHFNTNSHLTSGIPNPPTTSSSSHDSTTTNHPQPKETNKTLPSSSKPTILNSKKISKSFKPSQLNPSSWDSKSTKFLSTLQSNQPRSTSPLPLPIKPPSNLQLSTSLSQPPINLVTDSVYNPTNSKQRPTSFLPVTKRQPGSSSERKTTTTTANKPQISRNHKKATHPTFTETSYNDPCLDVDTECSLKSCPERPALSSDTNTDTYLRHEHAEVDERIIVTSIDRINKEMDECSFQVKYRELDSDATINTGDNSVGLEGEGNVSKRQELDKRGLSVPGDGKVGLGECWSHSKIDFAKFYSGNIEYTREGNLECVKLSESEEICVVHSEEVAREIESDPSELAKVKVVKGNERTISSNSLGKGRWHSKKIVKDSNNVRMKKKLSPISALSQLRELADVVGKNDSASRLPLKTALSVRRSKTSLPQTVGVGKCKAVSTAKVISVGECQGVLAQKVPEGDRHLRGSTVIAHVGGSCQDSIPKTVSSDKNDTNNKQTVSFDKNETILPKAVFSNNKDTILPQTVSLGKSGADNTLETVSSVKNDTNIQNTVSSDKKDTILPQTMFSDKNEPILSRTVSLGKMGTDNTSQTVSSDNNDTILPQTVSLGVDIPQTVNAPVKCENKLPQTFIPQTIAKIEDKTKTKLPRTNPPQTGITTHTEDKPQTKLPQTKPSLLKQPRPKNTAKPSSSSSATSQSRKTNEQTFEKPRKTEKIAGKEIGTYSLKMAPTSQRKQKIKNIGTSRSHQNGGDRSERHDTSSRSKVNPLTSDLAVSADSEISSKNQICDVDESLSWSLHAPPPPPPSSSSSSSSLTSDTPANQKMKSQNELLKTRTNSKFDPTPKLKLTNSAQKMIPIRVKSSSKLKHQIQINKIKQVEAVVLPIHHGGVIRVRETTQEGLTNSNQGERIHEDFETLAENEELKVSFDEGGNKSGLGLDNRREWRVCPGCNDGVKSEVGVWEENQEIGAKGYGVIEGSNSTVIGGMMNQAVTHDGQARVDVKRETERGETMDGEIRMGGSDVDLMESFDDVVKGDVDLMESFDDVVKGDVVGDNGIYNIGSALLQCCFHDSDVSCPSGSKSSRFLQSDQEAGNFGINTRTLSCPHVPFDPGVGHPAMPPPLVSNSTRNSETSLKCHSRELNHETTLHGTSSLDDPSVCLNIDLCKDLKQSILEPTEISSINNELEVEGETKTSDDVNLLDASSSCDIDNCDTGLCVENQSSPVQIVGTTSSVNTTMNVYTLDRDTTLYTSDMDMTVYKSDMDSTLYKSDMNTTLYKSDMDSTLYKPDMDSTLYKPDMDTTLYKPDMDSTLPTKVMDATNHSTPIPTSVPHYPYNDSNERYIITGNYWLKNNEYFDADDSIHITTPGDDRSSGSSSDTSFQSALSYTPPSSLSPLSRHLSICDEHSSSSTIEASPPELPFPHNLQPDEFVDEYFTPKEHIDSEERMFFGDCLNKRTFSSANFTPKEIEIQKLEFSKFQSISFTQNANLETTSDPFSEETTPVIQVKNELSTHCSSSIEVEPLHLKETEPNAKQEQWLHFSFNKLSSGSLKEHQNTDKEHEKNRTERTVTSGQSRTPESEPKQQHYHPIIIKHGNYPVSHHFSPDTPKTSIINSASKLPTNYQIPSNQTTKPTPASQIHQVPSTPQSIQATTPKPPRPTDEKLPSFVLIRSCSHEPKTTPKIPPSCLPRSQSSTIITDSNQIHISTMAAAHPIHNVGQHQDFSQTSQNSLPFQFTCNREFQPQVLPQNNYNSLPFTRNREFPVEIENPETVELRSEFPRKACESSNQTCEFIKTCEITDKSCEITPDICATREEERACEIGAPVSETVNRTGEMFVKTCEHQIKTSEPQAKIREPHAKTSEHRDRTSEPLAKASEPEAKTTEAQAKISEPHAKTSEPQTKTSEPQAKTSEPQAKTSEPQAKTSEPQAKTSEPQAKTSKPQAKTSEPHAKTSEPQTKTSEPQAKTSKPQAKTSEPQAKTSEPQAKTSEPQAKTSEPHAKTSEPQTKTSEPQAKTSEPQAKTSEPQAKTSEPQAKTSETQAKPSEPQAKTSEPQTKTSEPQAKTSEPQAKTSEHQAKPSEHQAKTSEPQAKTSEPIAKTSEPQAKTSEPHDSQEECKCARNEFESELETYHKTSGIDKSKSVQFSKIESVENIKCHIHDFGNDNIQPERAISDGFESSMDMNNPNLTTGISAEFDCSFDKRMTFPKRVINTCFERENSGIFDNSRTELSLVSISTGNAIQNLEFQTGRNEKNEKLLLEKSEMLLNEGIYVEDVDEGASRGGYSEGVHRGLSKTCPDNFRKGDKLQTDALNANTSKERGCNLVHTCFCVDSRSYENVTNRGVNGDHCVATVLSAHCEACNKNCNTDDVNFQVNSVYDSERGFDDNFTQNEFRKEGEFDDSSISGSGCFDFVKEFSENVNIRHTINVINSNSGIECDLGSSVCDRTEHTNFKDNGNCCISKCGSKCECSGIHSTERCHNDSPLCEDYVNVKTLGNINEIDKARSLINKQTRALPISAHANDVTNLPLVFSAHDSSPPKHEANAMSFLTTDTTMDTIPNLVPDTKKCFFDESVNLCLIDNTSNSDSGGKKGVIHSRKDNNFVNTSSCGSFVRNTRICGDSVSKGFKGKPDTPVGNPALPVSCVVVCNRDQPNLDNSHKNLPYTRSSPTSSSYTSSSLPIFPKHNKNKTNPDEERTTESTNNVILNVHNFHNSTAGENGQPCRKNLARPVQPGSYLKTYSGRALPDLSEISAKFGKTNENVSKAATKAISEVKEENSPACSKNRTADNNTVVIVGKESNDTYFNTLILDTESSKDTEGMNRNILNAYTVTTDSAHNSLNQKKIPAESRNTSACILAGKYLTKKSNSINTVSELASSRLSLTLNKSEPSSYPSSDLSGTLSPNPPEKDENNASKVHQLLVKASPREYESYLLPNSPSFSEAPIIDPPSTSRVFTATDTSLTNALQTNLTSYAINENFDPSQETAKVDFPESDERVSIIPIPVSPTSLMGFRWEMDNGFWKKIFMDDSDKDGSGVGGCGVARGHHGGVDSEFVSKRDVTNTNRAVTDSNRVVIDTNRAVTSTNTDVTDTKNAGTATNKTVKEFNKAVIDTSKSIPDTTKYIPDTTKSIPGTSKSIPDTSKSILDTTKSIPDTSKSIPDTTKSIPDTSKSIPDTSKSIPDTSKYIPDTTKSIPDTIKSIPDTSKSIPDTTKSIPDTTKSIPDTTKSTLDTSKSIPDTTKSILDTSNSITDTSKSITDTTNSIPDTSKSIPDTSKSIPDTSKSISDATKSILDTTKSIPDTTKSILDTTKSIPDTTKSITDTTNSIPDTSKSIPDTSKSIPDTSKSISDATKSILDTTKSIPDTTKSILDTTKSIPDTTKSIPDTTKSIPDTTKSIPDTNHRDRLNIIPNLTQTDLSLNPRASDHSSLTSPSKDPQIQNVSQDSKIRERTEIKTRVNTLLTAAESLKRFQKSITPVSPKGYHKRKLNITQHSKNTQQAQDTRNDPTENKTLLEFGPMVINTSENIKESSHFLHQSAPNLSTRNDAPNSNIYKARPTSDESHAGKIVHTSSTTPNKVPRTTTTSTSTVYTSIRSESASPAHTSIPSKSAAPANSSIPSVPTSPIHTSPPSDSNSTTAKIPTDILPSQSPSLASRPQTLNPSQYTTHPPKYQPVDALIPHKKVTHGWASTLSIPEATLLTSPIITFTPESTITQDTSRPQLQQSIITNTPISIPSSLMKENHLSSQTFEAHQSHVLGVDEATSPIQTMHHKSQQSQRPSGHPELYQERFQHSRHDEPHHQHQKVQQHPCIDQQHQKVQQYPCIDQPPQHQKVQQNLCIDQQNKKVQHYPCIDQPPQQQQKVQQQPCIDQPPQQQQKVQQQPLVSENATKGLTVVGVSQSGVDTTPTATPLTTPTAPTSTAIPPTATTPTATTPTATTPTAALETVREEASIAGARRHRTSAKLISVTLWDTHDGEKALRQSRRMWASEEKQALAEISETEESQPSHGSSTSGQPESASLHDSGNLHLADDCEERARASRSPVRPPVKPRAPARRSLSLPSGSLSYGDVKILYKDGHFVLVGAIPDRSSTTEVEESGGPLEDVFEEAESPDKLGETNSSIASLSEIGPKDDFYVKDKMPVHSRAGSSKEIAEMSSIFDCLDSVLVGRGSKTEQSVGRLEGGRESRGSKTGQLVGSLEGGRESRGSKTGDSVGSLEGGRESRGSKSGQLVGSLEGGRESRGSKTGDSVGSVEGGRESRGSKTGQSVGSVDGGRESRGSKTGDSVGSLEGGRESRGSKTGQSVGSVDGGRESRGSKTGDSVGSLEGGRESRGSKTGQSVGSLDGALEAIGSQTGEATDSLNAGVEDRSSTPRGSIFYSLPRRRKPSQRPVSADDATMWRSQQTLISQVEMDRIAREEEDEMVVRMFRGVSGLRRNNSFTEAMSSTFFNSDDAQRGSINLVSKKTEEDYNKDKPDTSIQQDCGRKSRSKGPGFIQRILNKRRAASAEKGLSVSMSSLKPHRQDPDSSFLSKASSASSLKPHRQDPDSSFMSKSSSISAASLQRINCERSDSRDSSGCRKISFHGLFRRRTSADMSTQKQSPPIVTFLSNEDIGAAVDSPAPTRRCFHLMKGSSSPSINVGVDFASTFKSRNTSPKKTASDSSTYHVSLFRSQSEDVDSVNSIKTGDGRSRSISERASKSGRLYPDWDSMDSSLNTSLSSAYHLTSDDGTLTPRSPSPSNLSVNQKHSRKVSPKDPTTSPNTESTKSTFSPQRSRRPQSRTDCAFQKSLSVVEETCKTTLSQGLARGDIMSSNSNDSGIQNDSDTNSSAESIQAAAKIRSSRSPSPTTDSPKADISVRWADRLTNVMESKDARRQPAVGRPRSDTDEGCNGNAADVNDEDEKGVEECGDKSEEKDNKGGLYAMESPQSGLHCASSLGNISTTETRTTSHSVEARSSTSTTTGSVSDVPSSLRSGESVTSLVEMRRSCRDEVAARLAKLRRLSTPQPIAAREEKPRTRAKSSQAAGVLIHAHSMPDNLDKLTRKTNYFSLLDAQNLASQLSVCGDSSDESEYSMDYHAEKLRSTRSLHSKLAAADQLLGDENLTYVEALWDHVTMDPDELPFRAGDLIQVTDIMDKHWWFGVLEGTEGWFPATFVRMPVNQYVTEEDLANYLADEELTQVARHAEKGNVSSSSAAMQQARTNVVNEIVTAERDYVKHLRDVIEGYVKQTRKRPEMFPIEEVTVIFSNIEDIYDFATRLLAELEGSVNREEPHLSVLGHCFLAHVKDFEMYSDYCNNHSAACEELRELYRNKRYRHFFEACRLLQEMIEIPLEGFLLTPVQKICKYHLQLAELLKFTAPGHPDFCQVQGALEAMKKIAMLINERKRKMESVEKLAAWQLMVDSWEGPDILDNSSELINSGELNKINHAGWSQERYFFLFDHQLIYCKKDLLKKSTFCFKGRINMDGCDVINVSDGRDPHYNVTVKNSWKLHDTHNDKWYLLVARTAVAKQRWLKAFQDERRRVREDLENNFNIPFHVKQAVISSFRQKTSTSKPKGRAPFARANTTQELTSYSSVHAIATLPRTKSRRKVKSEEDTMKNKKSNWFSFGKGKT